MICSMVSAQETDSAAAPRKKVGVVLIGRLGVSRDFADQGIGSEALQFIKGWYKNPPTARGRRCCKTVKQNYRNYEY